VGRWGWGLTDFLTGSGWGNKNKDATYSTVVCIFLSQVDSSGGSGFEKGNKKIIIKETIKVYFYI